MSVKRCDKVAFMKVGEKYVRMTNFTELTTSKNPKEYSRQYVDEEFERSDIVGYAPSISYAFDADWDNEVHKAIIDITDNEKTAGDAIVEIAIIDVAAAGEPVKAIVRKWSVVPDSEGGSLEAYTYSGSFKAVGGKTDGTATSTDSWQTATITTA